MKRTYTESELRSKLSQYANDRIASISAESSIHIRFKEGCGSTYGESFSQELDVSTIKELKEACTKAYLISLEEWEAQKAIDEINDGFIEAKEIEEAVEAQADEDKLAENQREFEDTHPSLAYIKEKYNELPPEAKDKIDWYSYGYNFGPSDPLEKEYTVVQFKEGILNDYQLGLDGKPQDHLTLTFKELEQGKLLEATQPEHFIGTPEYNATLKPLECP